MLKASKANADKDMILELQDMTYLDWATGKTMPGTPGCFVKAYEEVEGKRVYYKLSNYDRNRGIFGHESINELIANRLMNVLGIPHVDCKLVHAKVQIDGKEQETWLSVSEDFRKSNQEKMPYETYYDLKKENETPLEFAIRNGWELYMYQMFCIDYLIANRDRHGSNLEVIWSKEKDSVQMAPLFDQGVSLLFSTYGNEQLLEKADVMKDFPANNYIGERSLAGNLLLIPKDYDLKINLLREEDRLYIFNHMEEALSENHINKLWEMILKRWCHFEQIRNKKWK